MDKESDLLSVFVMSTCNRQWSTEQTKSRRQCLNSLTSVRVDRSGQGPRRASLDRTEHGTQQRQSLSLLLPLGVEQQEWLGQKGVEYETKHLQKRAVDEGPAVYWPPTCGSACVNMCKCSFMCMSYTDKDHITNIILTQKNCCTIKAT